MHKDGRSHDARGRSHDAQERSHDAQGRSHDGHMMHENHIIYVTTEDSRDPMKVTWLSRLTSVQLWRGRFDVSCLCSQTVPAMSPAPTHTNVNTVLITSLLVLCMYTASLGDKGLPSCFMDIRTYAYALWYNLSQYTITRVILISPRKRVGWYQYHPMWLLY